MCGNQSVSVVSESVSYPAGLGGNWHVVWAEEAKFSPLSSGEATEMKKFFAWSLMHGYSLEKTKDVAHTIMTKRREDYAILSEAAGIKELKRLQAL